MDDDVEKGVTCFAMVGYVYVVGGKMGCGCRRVFAKDRVLKEATMLRKG